MFFCIFPFWPIIRSICKEPSFWRPEVAGQECPAGTQISGELACKAAYESLRDTFSETWRRERERDHFSNLFVRPKLKTLLKSCKGYDCRSKGPCRVIVHYKGRHGSNMTWDPAKVCLFFSEYIFRIFLQGKRQEAFAKWFMVLGSQGLLCIFYWLWQYPTRKYLHWCAIWDRRLVVYVLARPLLHTT